MADVEVDVVEVPPALVALAKAWWLMVLVGTLCLVAGIVVIVQPGISLATLAVIAGIFLVIDGCFDLVSSLSRATDHRGLLALLGVLTVVVGVILIRHPSTSVVAIALLIGIWLIAFGLIRLVDLLSGGEGGGWSVAIAIFEIIGGIVIVVIPDIGVATLALLVAISFILRGIGMCVLGWGLRDAKHALSA